MTDKTWFFIALALLFMNTANYIILTLKGSWLSMLSLLGIAGSVVGLAQHYGAL